MAPAFLEALAGPLDRFFHIKKRGSTIPAELRAGVVLFMVSAYILFLNPAILSANGSTGIPKDDVLLATAISTGAATMVMGVVNYPWVVSVQLGTNTYFVNNVLQPGHKCGYHATFETGSTCAGIPCTCSSGPNGTIIVNEAVDPIHPCFQTKGQCVGTKIPYEQAFTATFLEGLVFLLICVTGMRSRLLKLLPKVVLMAGACGIGVFIAFVGVKNMGLITSAPWPVLLKLDSSLPYNSIEDGAPYNAVGWGANRDYGIDFNSCTMRLDGPPFGPVCSWLSVGGLIFTGLLLLWNVNGAFILGILFTMFIGWIKFPDKIGSGGLVPAKAVEIPHWKTTAFNLDFNWGDNTGKLTEALITFLYLDFIGSSITFYSLGKLCGIVNERGNIPRTNAAFMCDAIGSIFGGLLGSSALTTYVESAAAVKEGGKTGLTAVVCSVLFFISVFLAPIFSNIPDIATGPILVLIGVLIFNDAVHEIAWHDLSEAIPAFITMVGMPFTSNIAYGCIGGFIAYVIAKFATYQLFEFQRDWPGYAYFTRRTEAPTDMRIHIEGWNDGLPETEGKREAHGKGTNWFSAQFAKMKGTAPAPAAAGKFGVSSADAAPEANLKMVE